MRILIRADTSDGVGIGHLVRCLALARKLREHGARVALACAPTSLVVSRMISEAGCDVIDVTPRAGPARRRVTEEVLATSDQYSDAAATRDAAPDDLFDWIVVDHYGLDVHWERALRSHTKHILVVDDITNRRHDCDLLLDQNPGIDREARHRTLSDSSLRCLIGPQYALLRSGFSAARARSGPRNGPVGRILVMYGGTDPTDETTKAVMALRQLPGLNARIDVVAGSANPRSDTVRGACSADSRIEFHHDATNVPELMTEADIALGACGTSAWERCCVFLPTIAVVAAENQREIAAGLAGAGAAEISGWHADVTTECLARAVDRLARSPERVRAMSIHAGEQTDGGGTDRVRKIMEVIDADSRPLY